SLVDRFAARTREQVLELELDDSGVAAGLVVFGFLDDQRVLADHDYVADSQFLSGFHLNKTPGSKARSPCLRAGASVAPTCPGRQSVEAWLDATCAGEGTRKTLYSSVSWPILRRNRPSCQPDRLARPVLRPRRAPFPAMPPRWAPPGRRAGRRPPRRLRRQMHSIRGSGLAPGPAPGSAPAMPAVLPGARRPAAGRCAR